jgi:hypothetical protein
MKRWLATAAMVLGLLGAYTAPAHADPTNAPNAFPFTITCDGTTYTVVGVPGQGQWTPALITTSNQVLIPYSFDITVTNVSTGDIVFQETVSKPPADQVANVTCTFAFTDTDPETGETFSIVGTVEALRAPPVG